MDCSPSRGLRSLSARRLRDDRRPEHLQHCATLAHSSMQLPARIGKYELEELLGGGMARVYRARDTVIGRTVAVKILTEEGCADEATKARFLQEARLAGNVTHDNIISIYDFGEDAEGRPFM